MPTIQAGPRQLRPTYGDDEPRPYERIAPNPMSPTIGAEIDGISLAERPHPPWGKSGCSAGR